MKSLRALAHLLFQALARRVVPFEFRERVWQLIDLLAHDPDPTVSQDARNDDASQLGINSTPTYFIDGTEVMWVEDKVMEDLLRTLFPKLKSISYDLTRPAETPAR